VKTLTENETVKGDKMIDAIVRALVGRIVARYLPLVTAVQCQLATWGYSTCTWQSIKE
jgi:hypothetical protein